jgi:tRNA pseudouridine38-40 synthase
MKSAISPLMGQHDFKAFEGAGSPRSHTVRNVIRAEFNVDSSHHIDFIIEADGFLRYMVRNIMGTLVDIGRGKRRPGEMDTIIRSRNRSLAGATAPPQGLCLIAVKY